MTSSHSSRQVFTVAQINRYVRQLLDADALLSGVFIEGEISNYRPHSSGHMYFTLKDASGALSSVMFASAAQNLAFIPKNGQKIVALGRLSLYEKTGQYQLYIEHMEPVGIGDLHMAFSRLLEKLQGEGLFDETRKKPIPAYPACVAVITSPTGAAVQDIIKVVRQRNQAIKLVIVPAQVQGLDAAADLARAIKEVNTWGKADVIILGRGGGSIEDLWSFNEEVTARAIAESRIPIVAAVGHETDITIADFVADRRAPTPTAAAQIVAYDQAEAIAYLHEIYHSLQVAIKEGVTNRHNTIKEALTQICIQATHRLKLERQKLSHSTNLLEKVSPYTAFKRGFALVQNEAGKAVITAESLKIGEKLNLQWADGNVVAEIISNSTH